MLKAEQLIIAEKRKIMSQEATGHIPLNLETIAIARVLDGILSNMPTAYEKKMLGKIIKEKER